jgi:PPOX class probable F420-dependent enzyme
MGVRLSEDQAWREIAAAHTGVLTTLRADGTPVALPVWFVARERTIYVSTPPRAKKVARVRNDPRASFLVESGARWAELRAVHVNGAIDVVDDPATITAVTAELDAKYAAFRTATAALPAATRAHYAGRTILRFVPSGRILSWDNARLELREGG